MTAQEFARAFSRAGGAHPVMRGTAEAEHARLEAAGHLREHHSAASDRWWLSAFCHGRARPLRHFAEIVTDGQRDPDLRDAALALGTLVRLRADNLVRMDRRGMWWITTAGEVVREAESLDEDDAAE